MRSYVNWKLTVSTLIFSCLANCLNAQVLCQDADIRLRGGRNSTEGRVEICFNNQWGTVCHNSWDTLDATVVCTQLGLPSEGAVAYRFSSFGWGTGPIWLDNVRCSGTESRLVSCPRNGVGVSNCHHYDDAGVTCQVIRPPECSNDTDIRLAGGSNNMLGRVEICLEGAWGTVCDDAWDATDAAIVCTQLGLPSNGAIATTVGQGIGPIHLDEVLCTGNETRLAECQHQGIASHDCSHSEDAGVICPGHFNECNDTDVRLIGGRVSVNETFGTVEICFQGIWGTVCHDNWNNAAAAVVCRQLGFSSEGAIALHRATYGRGDGPIFLDDVFCMGNESRLADCQHQSIAFHDCSHYKDAGVICPGHFAECNDGDVRVAGGRVSVNESFGRVEICFSGIWGTVCHDSWDNTDAAVVCRQLGLSSEGAAALTWATFGESDRPIYLDEVTCMGNETRLAECQHQGIASHNCFHYKDAGVVCIGPVERCSERTNFTLQITDMSYRFGGVCQAYEGGSTLCDGEIGESVKIYISNARGSTQSQLTSRLNAVISVVFDTSSSRCQDLIRNVLCLNYYPPCSFNGTLTAPVSICPEECFYVQNECGDKWNELERLLGVPGSDLSFINCSNPGQILDPLPHCCVDAGITIAVSATTIAPVTAGVTVALLLLLVVAVILGLLWVKRRRRMKAADRSIPLEIMSWTRRNEHPVDYEPAKGANCKVQLTIPSHYNPNLRERKLTPVMSTQMRELTGKMLIPSSRIRLLDTIGHGEFGIVYKAHLLPQIQLASKLSRCPLPQTVAVKTLKGYFGGEEIDNMMSESVKMKHFDHPNVISLIGVCIDAGPAPYIIMPFMDNGSLLSYLKNHRTELLLPNTTDEEIVSDITKRLISMCLQVAKGMEYLAEQKFVHRDLAARNCMVDLHDMIKVSDFGLTEDVYARNYYRQAREDGVVKLPVKWMSLESLNDGVFTEKTDVWSFGITCWEIFSGGKNPYPGADLLTLVQLLENGRRLDKPLNAACSDTMYDIMQKCWQVNPDERPPFSTLVVLVSTDLEHQAGYLDFSFPTDTFSPEDSQEKCPASPSTTPPSPTPPSPTLPSPTPPSPTPPSPTLPSPPLIVVTQPDSNIN